jgi:DNA-binding NarL/FixJ family response regulator
VIRILVADDQALFRAGFRVLLEATDDLELAGEAADGRTAASSWPGASGPTWS